MNAHSAAIVLRMYYETSAQIVAEGLPQDPYVRRSIIGRGLASYIKLRLNKE